VYFGIKYVNGSVKKCLSTSNGVEVVRKCTIIGLNLSQKVKNLEKPKCNQGKPLKNFFQKPRFSNCFMLKPVLNALRSIIDFALTYSITRNPQHCQSKSHNDRYKECCYLRNNDAISPFKTMAFIEHKNEQNVKKSQTVSSKFRRPQNNVEKTQVIIISNAKTQNGRFLHSKAFERKCCMNLCKKSLITADIVRSLLITAGIETNPGPKGEPCKGKSSCCDKVELITYNVRGLGNPKKVTTLFNGLNKINMSNPKMIAVIQETHVNDWKKMAFKWRPEMVGVPGSGSSCGVAAILGADWKLVEDDPDDNDPRTILCAAT
jgi:hypothetical protein